MDSQRIYTADSRIDADSRTGSQIVHRYKSTDTGGFTDTTLPIIPGPNVPYLQRTTVPYPASPTEPLGTLTDRITPGAPLRRFTKVLTQCSQFTAVNSSMLSLYMAFDR